MIATQTVFQAFFHQVLGVSKHFFWKKIVSVRSLKLISKKIKLEELNPDRTFEQIQVDSSFHVLHTWNSLWKVCMKDMFGQLKFPPFNASFFFARNQSSNF